MHQSVLDFLGRSLTSEDVSGKFIVEVGSRIVFGSPRDVIQWLGPRAYVGTDMAEGKGVDLVIPAGKLATKFKDVDIVIATELLEHVEFWGAAVREMKAILKAGGILIITARGPGFPYHAHPGDFWRFTIEDFKRMFADFEILELSADPQQDHPGVFLKARKPANHVQADLAFEVRSVG